VAPSDLPRRGTAPWTPAPLVPLGRASLASAARRSLDVRAATSVGRAPTSTPAYRAPDDSSPGPAHGGWRLFAAAQAPRSRSPPGPRGAAGSARPPPGRPRARGLGGSPRRSEQERCTVLLWGLASRRAEERPKMLLQARTGSRMRHPP